MPRPEPPPTPASSTEIKGQDGSHFPPLQMSFELPPPAVAAHDSRPSSASTKPSSSSAASNSTSTSSYRPASPVSPALPASEVVKIRRRSSIAQKPAAKDSFALPPPPTRSRKIIQMKPREQPEEQLDVVVDGPKVAAGKAVPSKKKQPSATSVAGRKIARKTAHSLIERRRRSKMNEEFGVLKDMIPACTGEMHKLAILQASIDYVRYLEDCVAKLKAENSRSNTTPTSEQFVLPPPAVGRQYKSARGYAAYEDEDVDMDGSETHSPPSHAAHASLSQRPSESPALQPHDSHHRHNSYSSTSAERRHYSFSASSTTSPSLGPTAYDYARNPGSTLTSPALLPQRDLDQEATAALLMLNSDRRGTQGSAGRGMSVQDLLSA